MPVPKNLVTLTCRHCHSDVVPLLYGSPNQASCRIGAYCPLCQRWIMWVSHNTVWLALLEEQRAARSSSTPEPAPTPDGTKETWIAAIADMGSFCYGQAEAMGWHTTKRSTLERAMLVVTELAELSESARHQALQSPSEHIPEFTQAEEEWADVLVRVFDHSPDDGVTPTRLGQAFVAKLTFNRTRGYKHGGKTI